MADATITNTLNSRAFSFRTISPVGNNKKQPSIGIPLPNTGPGGVLLFRFLGQEEVFNFNFAITASTTDLSDVGAGQTAPAGDFPTGVKTIKEQIIYLRDFLYTAEFDAIWSFSQGSRYYTTPITVNIEDLDFDNQPGGASFVTGRMSLKRGKLAGT